MIKEEVPASAEIVIEGEKPTDQLEPEGPFGEFPGYMGMGGPNLFLNITCITHRKRPIWNAFISQFPPSESSTLRGVGGDGALYKFLKYDLSISSLVDLAFHRESGARPFCVISLQNPKRTDIWGALKGADAHAPGHVKIIIAVDDDIDPRDPVNESIKINPENPKYYINLGNALQDGGRFEEGISS